MDCGLSENSLNTLTSILYKFTCINKALLFGSRATGKYKEGSDIDIAIYGNIDFDDELKISSLIDDSNLPYYVDIVIYSKIKEPDLIKEIDKNGILIFQRN